jgi:hypothetical protein
MKIIQSTEFVDIPDKGKFKLFDESKLSQMVEYFNHNTQFAQFQFKCLSDQEMLL